MNQAVGDSSRLPHPSAIEGVTGTAAVKRSSADLRAELGAFLRQRRTELDRATFGLPTSSRSRTPGLRREEISTFAGVSVTWYTWLEQGRDVNPSRQVLQALARTLRLSNDELRYLLALAGHDSSEPVGEYSDVDLAHLQRFLDAQLPAPAFALREDWQIIAWNRAYELLYPRVGHAPEDERNLLRAIFTDPQVRLLLPDWEVTSRQFLAEFRTSLGSALAHPPVQQLIATLSELSPEFTSAWQDHAVARFPSGERTFMHPDAGELTFQQYQLTPSDQANMRIVVYLPHQDDQSWYELSQLIQPEYDSQ